MITKAELRYMGCRDRNFVPLALADLKFETHADPTKPVTFEGYGSVWNNVDSYGDTILPGAFAKSIKSRMPMMFLGHNTRIVPGKWMSVVEDAKGLKMVGELTPGHSAAADLAASLKHGSMNGLSIGGYTEKSDPGPNDTRQIAEFDLWEVSPVTLPAEQEARIDTASVKDMLESCDTIRKFEGLIRDGMGISSHAACALTSRFVKVARGEPVEAVDIKELGRVAALVRSQTLPPWS